MIAKGQSIKCPQCGAVVFVAKVDLHQQSPLRSQDLSYPDGREVPFMAPIVCPKCGILYSTVNSETADLEGSTNG